VYDYTAGKSDWMAAGLPTEGAAAGRPTAATVARREVPTCRLEESLRDVRERVRAAGWNACVVVNEKRIVMGLLATRDLPNVPVTTSAGELLGLLVGEDGERAVHERQGGAA
jgi:CBS domain-containing protein